MVDTKLGTIMCMMMGKDSLNDQVKNSLFDLTKDTMYNTPDMEKFENDINIINNSLNLLNIIFYSY